MSAPAALTTLQIMSDDALPDRAMSLGEVARAMLEAVAERHFNIREDRSAGLMLTLDLKIASFDRGQANKFAVVVFWACVEKGVLPVFLHAGSLTTSMPLIIDKGDLLDSIELIEKAIQKVGLL